MIVDLRRLTRALTLEAKRVGDGWLVTGGSQPWLVSDASGCPCPDRTMRGAGCKHEIRVELAALSPEILAALCTLLALDARHGNHGARSRAA